MFRKRPKDPSPYVQYNKVDQELYVRNMETQRKKQRLTEELGHLIGQKQSILDDVKEYGGDVYQDELKTLMWLDTRINFIKKVLNSKSLTFGKQYTRLANDLKKVKTKKDATKMWYRVNRFGQKLQAEFGNDEESGWFASSVIHPIRNWLCVQAKNRWDWCPEEESDWGWFESMDDEELESMAFGEANWWPWGKRKESELTQERLEEIFAKMGPIEATPYDERMGVKYRENPMFSEFGKVKRKRKRKTTKKRK